jgi:hypothetical protein
MNDDLWVNERIERRAVLRNWERERERKSAWLLLVIRPKKEFMKNPRARRNAYLLCCRKLLIFPSDAHLRGDLSILMA